MIQKIFRIFALTAFLPVAFAASASAQTKTPTPNKINKRPVAKVAAEPFAGATVQAMAAQCVKFETDAGAIELEMFPETAPETVRAFLNLVAGKFFDTTTFSRVVPGFVVQGGNLATRQQRTAETDKRSYQTIADEPNGIKHERGIVSMARAETANSATTNFFILLNEAKHLDGTFAAFGRVIGGMETVEAIGKMPVNGDQPIKPVRLIKATTALCPLKPNP